MQCSKALTITVATKISAQFRSCYFDTTATLRNLHWDYLRGRSTTTWAKVYPILTPPPNRVNRNGHFTSYLLSTLYHMTPSCTFFWPPHPSSCPRSYWMPYERSWTPLSEDNFIEKNCNWFLHGWTLKVLPLEKKLCLKPTETTKY